MKITRVRNLSAKALSVALGTLLLTTCIAGAQTQRTGFKGGPGGMPSGMGPGGGMMSSCPANAMMIPQSNQLSRMSQSLSLTDDQLASLKKIVTDNSTSLQALEKKASESTKSLKNALYETDYDSAKVAKLVTSAEEAEHALITARLGVWKQIRVILTVDQVSKLKETMSSPRGMMMPGQRPQNASKSSDNGSSSDMQMTPPEGNPPDGNPPSGGPDGTPPSGDDGSVPPPPEQ